MNAALHHIRTQIEARDSRAVLWFGSAFIHAVFAAILLTRAPHGLTDRHQMNLSLAPQIELGTLPAPSTGQAEQVHEAPQQQEITEPVSEPVQQDMAKAEPAPVMSEQTSPAAIENLPQTMDAQEPPSVKAETPPAPVKKEIKPVTRTAKPAPRKPRKPVRDAESKPARASGTMAGAASNNAQSGAERANYGALLRAEIMRRRIYPPEAASRGDEGTVVARVTIGASGKAISHGVVKSSGIAAFDHAVPRIMARLSLPPPPGGQYTGTVAIRFALD